MAPSESPSPTDGGVLSDLSDLPDGPVRPDRRDHVAAVLVCRDGARWLPAVLTLLARSDRTPHRVVAVDAGSTDATGRLLASAVSEGVVDEVVTVPAATGFGAAVAAAIPRTTPVTDDWTARQQWLWLLHDDCAPAPYALDELLHASDDAPSIAVVGPKVRGWHDARLLLECGVTMTRGGTRVTGLERGEQDQGQRDGLRDVLAVGTAGMLVRRDVWDELGGFDPALPLFRDDVDLCWRAHRAGHRVVVTGDAVVNHREAATRGRRTGVGGPGEPSPRRLDRAAALHLLLAHAHPLALPLVLLRLLVGSLLRAVVYLLGKSPREAGDEVGALLDVLRHPGALRRSRALAHRAAKSPTAAPEREVRSLLAPRTSQLRQLWERVVGTVLSGSGGAAADEAELGEGDGWVVPQAPSRFRSALTRPGVILTLSLTLATALAVRSLLGAGRLVGGALLPAPDGAGDLWDAYLSGWHDVGLGSAALAPPWLAVLAAPAGLLLGQAPLAVDVLLLFCVPLAGLSAYLTLRGVVASTAVRCWAAATYALLPALPLAVGAGRLGTAVVAVLLPPLARSAARLLGAGRVPTWRRAWGTALLLAAAAAFVPAVWLVAAVLALVALALVHGMAARLRLLAAVLTPLVLLGPWTLRVLGDPGLVLLEPGLTGPADRRLDGTDLLLLHPGGPGSTPLWWTLPVVVAGAAALLRRDRRRAAVAAWTVAFVALGLGLVQLGRTVVVEGVVTPVRPWPGPVTLIAGGALIAGAALAADGIRSRSARWGFGWRQPALLLLAVATVLPALGAAVVWVEGVGGPLRRTDTPIVPAFVAADLQTPARPRTLVIRAAGDHVEYELLNHESASLGDRDTAAVPPDDVDAAVGALVAGVGGDEVDLLSAWSVKYVALQGAAVRDHHLTRTLDGQSGLRRVAGSARSSLWQVADPAARVTVEPDSASGSPVALPVDGPGVAVDADITAAALPGRLVLAQTAAGQDSDRGWVARSGDGAVLADATLTGADGAPAPGRWAATVPAGTAAVSLSFQDSGRSRALWVQAALLLLVVALAMPARRRSEPDDDDDLDQTLTASTGGPRPPPPDAPAGPAPSEPRDPAPPSVPATPVGGRP